MSRSKGDTLAQFQLQAGLVEQSKEDSLAAQLAQLQAGFEQLTRLPEIQRFIARQREREAEAAAKAEATKQAALAERAARSKWLMVSCSEIPPGEPFRDFTRRAKYGLVTLSLRTTPRPMTAASWEEWATGCAEIAGLLKQEVIVAEPVTDLARAVELEQNRSSFTF